MNPRTLIDATLALPDPALRAQVANIVWWDALAEHPCACALAADMARWSVKNIPRRHAVMNALIAVGYSRGRAWGLTRGMAAQSRVEWLAGLGRVA
jgi:hypothetical protein